MSTVATKFSDGDPVRVRCLWDESAAGGAGVHWDGEERVVTVDARRALGGVDPRRVNPLTWRGRRAHPAVVGVVTHGAAHAASTVWGAEVDALAVREPDVVAVMRWFEDVRVEFRQCRRRPSNRFYLRASAGLVTLAGVIPLLGGDGELPSVSVAAEVCALVYGRVSAGVFTDREVARVGQVCSEVLGEETFSGLCEVQSRAVRCVDGDTEALAGLAREWLSLLPADTPNHGNGTGPGAGAGDESGEPDAPGDDEPGEDESAQGAVETTGATGQAGETGDPAGARDDDPFADTDETDDGQEWANEAHEEAPNQLQQALTEVTDSVQESVHEAQDEDEQTAKTQQAAEKETAKRDAEAAETKRNKSSAKKALATRGTDEFFTYRTPTSGERRSSKRIAEALKRAQFRDRTVTMYNSMTPPGRLKGREAMLGAAQRAQGAMVTARPFQAVRKRHTPEPPITVAVLGDASGSMGWAESALGPVSWMFGNAMSQVAGDFASAVFGKKVHVLTRPGEYPKQVADYHANDGWEDLAGGIRVADGLLGLLRGTGVRLLVVISDGIIVDRPNRAASQELLRAFIANGGRVLWVGAGSTSLTRDLDGIVHARQPKATSTQTGLAEVIIDALVAAVREV